MCVIDAAIKILTMSHSDTNEPPLGSNLIHFPNHVWCVGVISNRNTRHWCKVEVDITHLLSHGLGTLFVYDGLT